MSPEIELQVRQLLDEQRKLLEKTIEDHRISYYVVFSAKWVEKALSWLLYSVAIFILAGTLKILFPALGK